MEQETRSIPIQISLPRQDRDKLKQLVASRMVQNPAEQVTVSGICREIIRLYLDSYSTKIGSQSQTVWPEVQS